MSLFIVLSRGSTYLQIYFITPAQKSKEKNQTFFKTQKSILLTQKMFESNIIPHFLCQYEQKLHKST